MNLPQQLRLATMSLCGFLFVSCSSFGDHWRMAGAPSSAEAFAGRWDGSWHSTRGTHHGKLQCVFTKIDPTHYRAEFDAHWMIFSAPFTAVFTTEQHGRTLRFKGKQDLGAAAGGVYTYNGTVTDGRFQSSYDSSYDTGLFELTRPK